MNGFAWGLCVWLCKGIWFLYFAHKQQIYVSGGFLWLLFLIWFSCLGGIWFYLVNRKRNGIEKILITVLYFYFMMHASMIIIGRFEGYAFCNPCVSLAVYPSLLAGMLIFDEFGCLFCLISFQYVIARFLRTFDVRYLFLGIIVSLSFLGGIFFYSPRASSPISMVILPLLWQGKSQNPVFVGEQIGDGIMRCKHKQSQLILAAESAFPFEINEYLGFLSTWSEQAGKSLILLGIHRRCKNKQILNSCVGIKQGGIVFLYDKQHAMPYLECAMWDLSTNLKRINEDCIDIDGTFFQIFMCSELFCESKVVKNMPILFIWNDVWLCCDYMKNLAELFIHYFELKYGVKVFYVSTQGRTNVG